MWLILSSATFVASVLVHAIVSRFAERSARVTTFLAIAGATGIVLIGHCLRSYGLSPATIAATLTYAFTCELYVFLFTLVGNSVSFGLLTKLASRRLTPADMPDCYPTEAMIARRLEQLEAGEFIASCPAGIRLTVRGKRIVKVFSLFHVMFRRPNRWTARVISGSDDAS